MTSVDQLLAPLPGNDPCGEDLSTGTSLFELDALVIGKPETQFNEAEEADWRQVRQRALELFKTSRDLRVAVALCISLLKTEGLDGLRDGLAVLRGLIEKYWEHVYPKLDPDDNNDPLQRLNILGVLSAPLGAAGDSMRFIEKLREVSLTNSRQLGRLTFGRLQDFKDGTSAAASNPDSIDPGQIDAAFRDTPAEEIVATHKSIVEALDNLHGIESALNARVTAVQSPNFGEIKKTLTAMKGMVAPYISPGSDSTSSPATEEVPAANKKAANTPAARNSGPINSREDILRALEQIRQYYTRHEPASPIPLMIRRVERIVPMTFIQILSELAPDSLTQVNTIVGAQE